MSKPKEFWIPLTTLIVNSDSKRPDGMHVIEAAPVLAEVAALKAKVKKLEALIAATYDAQNG